MNTNVSDNCILIDVRSPEEFQTGHIEGSINIPLGYDLSDLDVLYPNKNELILTFCASGMRSSTFKSQLEAKGYKNVINGGGVSAVALALNKKVVI